MGTLATLTVDLVAQSASFHEELRRASRGTRDFATQARDNINIAGKAFSAMGAVAATGLAAMVASANNSIDTLAKTSDKIGITTKSLSSLRYAGELTGVSINAMDMALQRMTRRVAEAAKGTGEAKDALKELGLDADRLNEIGPDKAFIEISKAMGDVENQSDKVRLAMKLFDSEGVALVNTMALGAEGLNKAAQEADAFGIAVSRIDAAQIEAANDSMYKAQQVADGFGNSLAVEVAPYIEAVATSFTDAAAEAGGFGQVTNDMIQGVGTGIGIMADGIHGISLMWGAAEVAGNAFGTVIAHMLRSIDHAIVDTLNVLPGISLEYSTTLDGIRDTFVQRTEETAAALAAKLEEPLPSDQIKAWMADVSASAEENAQKTAKSIADRNARVEGLEVDHQQAVGQIKDQGAKDEIQSLEQHTGDLIQAIQDQNDLKRKVLDQQFKANLISYDQYHDEIYRLESQLKNEVAGVNAEASHLYSDYLNSLVDGSDNAAVKISGSMAGAAGSMADSFKNAATQSIAAIQSVTITQASQRAAQNNATYSGVVNNGLPGYNDNGDYTTGNTNDPYGFIEYAQQNDRIVNPYDRQVNPYQRQVSYYHTGGIVGEDLGAREVNTTLLQGEGVFTENQMSAMAPVYSIINAIEQQPNESQITVIQPLAEGAGNAARGNHDFLAEYARIGAKHVENNEIRGMRYAESLQGIFNASIVAQSDIAKLSITGLSELVNVDYTTANVAHVDSLSNAFALHAEALTVALNNALQAQASATQAGMVDAFDSVNLDQLAQNVLPSYQAQQQPVYIPTTFQPSGAPLVFDTYGKQQKESEAPVLSERPAALADKLTFIQGMMDGAKNFDAYNFFDPYLKPGERRTGLGETISGTSPENIISITGYGSDEWVNSNVGGAGFSVNDTQRSDRYTEKQGVSYIKHSAGGFGFADEGVLNVNKDGRVTRITQEYDRETNTYNDQVGTDLGILDVNTDTQALREAGVSEHFIKQVEAYQNAVFDKLFATYEADIKAAQDKQKANTPVVAQTAQRNDISTGVYQPPSATGTPTTAPAVLEYIDSLKGWDGVPESDRPEWWNDPRKMPSTNSVSTVTSAAVNPRSRPLSFEELKNTPVHRSSAPAVAPETGVYQPPVNANPEPYKPRPTPATFEQLKNTPVHGSTILTGTPQTAPAVIEYINSLSNPLPRNDIATGVYYPSGSSGGSSASQTAPKVLQYLDGLKKWDSVPESGRPEWWNDPSKAPTTSPVTYSTDKSALYTADDISGGALQGYDDISDYSKKTWANAGDDITHYARDFNDNINDIVDEFDRSIELMRSNSHIDITVSSTSEFLDEGIAPVDVITSPLDVIDEPVVTPEPVKPSYPITPTRPVWDGLLDEMNKPIFLHSGGIAGTDKSNREIDATLLKGEGVFTQAQMSALAPISALNNQGSSGAKVTVNVHEAANTQTEIRQTEQANGEIRIDVIARAVEGQIARRMQAGGGLAKTIQTQYGLRRGG